MTAFLSGAYRFGGEQGPISIRLHALSLGHLRQTIAPSLVLVVTEYIRVAFGSNVKFTPVL